MVNGNQIINPLRAGFKIKSEKLRSQTDSTCMNFIMTTHIVAQSCVCPPICLYTFCITSGQAPDETAVVSWEISSVKRKVRQLQNLPILVFQLDGAGL